MSFYTETPLQIVEDPVLDQAGVRLIIKREDLNHPLISGNKWWKLKYNLAKAKQDLHHTVLTFGGAFSNHIFATAAMANEAGLNSIGIIRGEDVSLTNPFLAMARSKGMHFQFVTRTSYREKSTLAFIDNLREQFGRFYLIPEGGTNTEAVRGCEEFAKTKLNTPEFDELYLPVGTGGTIAGLICGFEGVKKIKGVSVLKDGAFLTDDIKQLVYAYSGYHYGNWSVLTSYHQGGYAKSTKALLEFVEAMKQQHNLPLDHVYTGKLLFAVFEEIRKGHVPRGSTVMALHTGGLQTSHFSEGTPPSL